MPLTEYRVQRALIHRFWSSSLLLMPNYTPRNWWECDLFRVTNAGYFYEYEIKLSRSDFKADAHKIRSRWGPKEDGKWGFREVANKHQLLKDGKEGPKHFLWVIPEGLIELEEIEEWAGVIHITGNHGRWCQLREVRKPQLINEVKVEQHVIDLARERAYYRYLHGFGRERK